MDQEQKEFDFLITEHKALRDEILRRIVLKHQLIALALIGIGTFLTFSIKGSAGLLFAYPILAMFIAAAWSHNEKRIRQTAAYIKAIEEKFFNGKIGWEHIRQSKIEEKEKLISHSLLAAQGIIIGTQVIALIALIMDWIKRSYPTEDIILLALEVIAIIITAILLRRYKVEFEIDLKERVFRNEVRG